MGIFVSRYITHLFGNKEVKVCMIGLDAAGKTTVLSKLHLGESGPTIPTIGFNVEKIKYGSLTMTIWDVGGQDRLRGLWSYYYSNLDGIIFVVDSNDTERLQLARTELTKVLSSEELRGVPLLLYANKQDLPHAASVSELTASIQLQKLCASREWFAQGCCAPTGEGLASGLEWLSQAIKRKNK